jgi:hypothetical protein
MVQLFFRGIFCAIFLAFFSYITAMEISRSEAESIGRGIFFNECGDREDRLVWWNEGEDFASLGIGHFIWYPEDCRAPYEETFPLLLAFFKAEGVELPKWLKPEEGCPWSNKEEFSEQKQETAKKQLKQLLSRTMALQTAFIAKRFEQSLSQILDSMSEEQRKRALKQIQSLEKSLQGKFALIDYLNFKGKGTIEAERYRGKGWGLKQVLEEMPADADNPLKAFSETAKALLKQRVEAAPPERNEQRYLKGWIARIERYTENDSKVFTST